MSISMYDASVPPMLRMLANVAAVLDKAAAFAAARKIDPAVLLGMRLAPDMFPLTRQVQLVSDFAKSTAARLAGAEVPKYDDTEKSIDELKARLARTAEFVKGLKREQIDGSEERDITIPIGGQPRTFKGLPYLLNFALPNFYFHATAGYAILRHAGVDLGKRDFIGPG